MNNPLGGHSGGVARVKVHRLTTLTLRVSQGATGRLAAIATTLFQVIETTGIATTQGPLVYFFLIHT
jgi:hypothetical protein